ESIRFPDQSVNRSKYSRPLDVLWPTFADWGVLSFPGSAVPASLIAGDGQRLQCRVADVPLRDNYSHSGIWVLLQDARLPAGKKPTAQVRRDFRQHVAMKATILFPAREPQAA